MKTLTLSSSLVIAAGFALAGCSDRLVEPPAPLGGSVIQNHMAQVVDPVPDSTEVAPPLNGERNNAAQKRYEKGTIIIPIDVRTSNVTTAGSGNSGGK
jgi:hypothetical protein